MTTIQIPHFSINKGAHDALVDQLRSCLSTQEILEFEKLFNSKTKTGPLHEIICELLRTRSISRGVAAKWLSVLLKDKHEKLNQDSF